MKKIFKILIPLIILSIILYQSRDTIRTRLLPFINGIIARLGVESLPCSNPIIYTLGTFDMRFDISKSYFLDALKEAEAIWEKPLGKELFAYKEDAEEVLKVNLVYDYRQQATSKLASLGIVVENTRASYDMLKARFTALKTEYEKEKIDFNAQVESFNKKQLAYENKVKFWNKKGGAPQEEYDRLNSIRLALEAELKELQTMQEHINSTTDEINALVVALNRLITSLNLSVERYNTTNESRGESFEEGVYYGDGVHDEIDIYEFSSREKLVRVLAHELGHALRLEHVDDTRAIMYRLNQKNDQTLTAADLEALKTRCGIK